MANGWGQAPWGLTPWGVGAETLAITGTAEVGYTLAATAGFMAYQWQDSLNGVTWANIVPANGSLLALTTSELGRFIRVEADGQYSTPVGPVTVFVEQPETSDSYVAQLFRDNGRFVDTTYGELLFQERRRRGRRVR